MNKIIIFLGRSLSFLSQKLNLGNGSTWPGHFALMLNKNFIKQVLKDSKVKIIFITGTNGKTTTSKLIQTILNSNGHKVIANPSGANLLNGIASSLISSRDYLNQKKDVYAIFEIDENAFPIVSNEIEPDFLISLNLFRDQLDRYGEIDAISKKWKKTIEKFSKTTLILNSDDPQISFLGFKNNLKTYYFGLDDKSLERTTVQHGADSILCPNCSERLEFSSYYFSHLGIWSCKNCNFKREKPTLNKFSYYPLTGTYALYDILAAVLLCSRLGLKDSEIIKGLKNFKPAFGRQEELVYRGTKIEILLAKNPISFNESLDTAKKLGCKSLIFALNDRIPDGLDVSWIWDIDFENLLSKDMNIFTFGDRASDMTLRLKYANHFTQQINNFEEGLDKIIENLEDNEKLFILPNYSAMLDIRKILTGKKIL